MSKMGQRKREQGTGGGRLPAGLLVLFLCLLAVPAQALVVTVDLGWGWDATANTDLSDYNLQEGSIVQIILYDSAMALPPGTEADDNFDIFSAGTPTVYDPITAPDGHVIAYTTQIGSPINPNANGYDWYNIYAQFEILGTYDSLYVRIFGMTNFPDGVAAESYWGLSEVQTGTNIVGTWYVGPLDEITPTNLAYFEVIPEPGSLALLALGGTGLWFGHRRRKNRVSRV